MGINKVYFGNRILIDLTKDTVSEETLLFGKTAHAKNGEKIYGTCRFDVNSTDATATSNDILEGKTAYANGDKLTGTMANIGVEDQEITVKTDVKTISEGYHNGLGTVKISKEEQDKLTPQNILEGITILGVTGTLKPSEITDFGPTMIFYDTIVDEDGESLLDENGDELLGAYVYHRA